MTSFQVKDKIDHNTSFTIVAARTRTCTQHIAELRFKEENKSIVVLLTISSASYLGVIKEKRTTWTRGERIIRYSNNIRITNIRIRPQIEYYSYSYSSKSLGPNIIRIRPKIWVQILFVFVFVQKFGSEYHSY